MFGLGNFGSALIVWFPIKTSIDELSLPPATTMQEILATNPN